VNRGYNFSAGPAQLPESILQEVQAELLNWREQACSILEIGHRTKVFETLMQEMEQDLRDLLAIPENYHVLFLGGAARTQFAMVPMNILEKNQSAAHVISGTWSELAFEESARITSAYCLANSVDTSYSNVPFVDHNKIKANTAYVQYTPNETIHGVRFPETPDVKGLPLVADMTSCLLSEPFDINRYGLIFAGAQKNIASAGMTVVIIRSDWLERKPNMLLPIMSDYRTHAKYKSLYATPPTFNCYLAAKMFIWAKKQGGVEGLNIQNIKKANMLYDYIDSSSFYYCRVEKSARSRMNICFALTDPESTDEFLLHATQAGLYALNGHRQVGGLRASIYNSMPIAGVEALIEFMKFFAAR